MAKKKKDKMYGPVLVIMYMILGVGILSFLLSLIGFESTRTIISNGTIETTLVTVKNLISIVNIR